jgi:hypothetical protein
MYESSWQGLISGYTRSISLYLAVCDCVNFCVTMKIVFADSGDEEEIQTSSSSNSELNKVNTKQVAHNLPLPTLTIYPYQSTQFTLTRAHNVSL